jgi:hypothetical protein
MGTGTPYQGVPQPVRWESTNAAIRDRSSGADIFQMCFEPSLAETQSSAVVTGPNGRKSRLPMLQAAMHRQNPDSSILMGCLRVIWLRSFAGGSSSQLKGFYNTRVRQRLISLDCVFDAPLVPVTCPELFVDSRELIRQVPGESFTRR